MKEGRKCIKRVIELIGNIYLFLGCVMLALCVGSTVCGVFFRFILHSPLKWVEEAAALTQAWMVCLLIPQMDIKYEHITMEIVFNAVKKPVKIMIRVFQSILTCGLAVVLLKYAIGVVQMNAKLNTITGTLLIPYKYVYMALPVMFVLMLVVHISKLITADFGVESDRTADNTADNTAGETEVRS